MVFHGLLLTFTMIFHERRITPDGMIYQIPAHGWGIEACSHEAGHVGSEHGIFMGLIMLVNGD